MRSSNEPGSGKADNRSNTTSFIRLAAQCAALGQGRGNRLGRVSLVGAGPGDPDLLTVKAVQALQCADVILFDDLVSDEILERARREAQRILVGKRGGRVSCRQDTINEAMLMLAKQGLHVVRLKSGDPMIFGRAGEEIDALEEAGIQVDVVPGVTAALGAAASLRVSLTHRDCAQGVKFITAHSREGMLPELDWRSCSDGSTTLVLYMGGRTAPDAAHRLIAEGRDPSTPVIVGWAVSRANERFEGMTLQALSKTTIPTSEPVLVGIGQVFAPAMRRWRRAAGSGHHISRNVPAFEAVE